MLATGEQHSVAEFLALAFEAGGLGDPEPYVELDRRYLRPTEVDSLCGDASKAERELGWQPSVRFAELVERMVAADIEALGEAR